MYLIFLKRTPPSQPLRKSLQKRTKPLVIFRHLQRERAGFDFLLSIFMVIHCVIGCGVHPMKHIWQVPVMLKVKLNKIGRKPTGFPYFVFDFEMVELR